MGAALLFLNKSIEKRLDDPFLGQYSLSFIIFNWKLFAAYFKLEWPEYKAFLESYPFPMCGYAFLWVPLLVSLFLCLGYPWVASLIDDYRMKIVLASKKAKFKRLTQEYETSKDVDDFVTKLDELEEVILETKRNLSNIYNLNQNAKRNLKAFIERNKDNVYGESLSTLFTGLDAALTEKKRQALNFNEVRKHKALLELKKYSEYLDRYLKKVREEKDEILQQEVDSSK